MATLAFCLVIAESPGEQTTTTGTRATGVRTAEHVAPAAAVPRPDHTPRVPLSLLLESRASAWRGARYLVDRQLPNGSWANHPVVTALCTLALANAGSAQPQTANHAIESGLAYLRKHARRNGAILSDATRQYPVHATAIAVLPFIRISDPDDHTLIIAARNYVARHQIAGPETDSLRGGFPAKPGDTPDLMTTQWALETLYLAEYILDDNNAAPPEIFDSALEFILACQKNNGTSRGAFAAAPHPHAPDTHATPLNPVLLTAAGIKSLVYAKAPEQSHELIESIDWLEQRWRELKQTPDKIPDAGGYTTLYFIAKAFKALERRDWDLSTPPLQNWRVWIVRRLMQLQSGNGGWTPGQDAWWENRPELVTAYALLTLERLLGPEL